MAAALLAGCAGSQPPIGTPGAMPQSRAIIPHNERSGSSQTSSVPDGFGPNTRLVALKGQLYGTTSSGGANNEGTVYRITTGGSENVVYSFAPGCRRKKKCSDGLVPTSIVRVNSTLYGTTLGGGLGPCFNVYGPNGCGTVFSVTPSGVETVLYSFESECRYSRDCPDAQYSSGLSAIDRTLYGTSYFGGTYGSGTVYSVTTSGVEKVIYSFAGGSKGSLFPNGGVINVNGALYGTMYYGGTQNAGFVFSLSTSGVMNVLYSFDAPKRGGSAGAYGSLINVNDVLYGMTGDGGAYQKGTVFSITKNGTVTVLHSFGAGCGPRKRCSDGEYPDSGLIDGNGILYGVTAKGGTHGSGTVFSITTSGSEKVLHSFSHAHRGPGAGLTELNGILYGITGGGRCDGGTIFSITLSGKVKVLHSFC
jgi:uncharacterized repeat protein (TIGR03803 family)